MGKIILNRPNSIVDDAWLQLGDLNGLEIENPLETRYPDELQNPGLREMRLMRNPSYLGFAAKVLLNIDVAPFQSVILEELWTRPFPILIMNRGASKSYSLALYAMLACVLLPETKFVFTGAVFRQSRVIFDYMLNMWNSSTILHSICDGNSGPTTYADRLILRINDSVATFIPLGDGQKVRGLRANKAVVDEFSSVSPEIYETVIAGFAAVSHKPIDKIKGAYRRKALKEQGKWSHEEELAFFNQQSNQCIISGTCSYDFLHFADYWKKYWTFINSKNDPDKVVTLPNGDTKRLTDYYPEGLPDYFDYRDYSIVRIPYDLLPEGFMDEKVISRARGMMNSSIFNMEYMSIFSADSDGFFRRTLIEHATAKKSNREEENWPSYCKLGFPALIVGNPGKTYIYGIDPAAHQDNFTIVILEQHEEHTRIVYCWSTNVDDFKHRKSKGLTKEHDYYAFCSRKIRDLMKVFPTTNIAIDGQGGGTAIIEALHDPVRMSPGEQVLLPTTKILKPGKELDTDDEPGLHIIHVCQFIDYAFTSEANHGLRKDLEDRVLLFPDIDSVSLELAAIKDLATEKKNKDKKTQHKNFDSLYDGLETCYLEIEELKNELTSIKVSRTNVQGRERWDTPENVNEIGKKYRVRKDRYSALVMANFIAHKLLRPVYTPEYETVGGFASDINRKKNKSRSSQLYKGPEWFTPINRIFSK